MTAPRWLFAVAIALAADAPAAHAVASAADSAAHTPLLARVDAVFAAGAGVAIAIAATHDRAWSAHAGADRSGRARDLATLGRQFGDPLAVASSLLASDALARLAGHPRVGAATERVALAAASAGAVTFALKEAFGRGRPDEPPGGPSWFAPFSRHDAMPSGHTTVAFALASGICAESRSRWAPAVLYPAAALTAWSRVHDRRHWPSDVVAGAAIGTWVAGKVDRIAQRRLPRGLVVLVCPVHHGAAASARVSF